MQFTIHHMDDWQHIAEKVASALEQNILLLKGNLGAGKTTFTQFLLKKLESADEVSSPTYSIVNEYNTPQGKVYHLIYTA